MKPGILLVVVLMLAGCSIEIGSFSLSSGDRGTKVTTATARASTEEALLTAEGECQADASLDPATRPLPREIALGITECELVRLKATRPDDVLIGESGKGQREVQVLYNEPGAREIYMFTDNRLTRIVKPGQG